MTPDEVLDQTRSVLLIDWPSAAVPETLARAGYDVVSHEGPSDADFYVYTAGGSGQSAGSVDRRPATGPPAQADLVYTHRPNDELPAIVELANALGARAVWCQTDSPEASGIVEGAGLAYVGEPSIVDAVGRRITG